MENKLDWSILEDQINHEITIIEHEKGQNYPIAKLSRFDTRYRDNGRAQREKAILIAAAPDLYKALDRLLIEISPIYNFDLSKAPDCVQDALKAISKTKGKQ